MLTPGSARPRLGTLGCMTEPSLGFAADRRPGPRWIPGVRERRVSGWSVQKKPEGSGKCCQAGVGRAGGQIPFSRGFILFPRVR